MSKINHYFRTYTQSDECFETADGFLFHKKPDAEAHAATLSNKKVETHKRLNAELRSIVKENNEKSLGKIGKNEKPASGKGKKDAAKAPAAEKAPAENAAPSLGLPADNTGVAE